jgi:hypothetical protein
MDVNQFIQNAISGNASEAKENLNDILSTRAFQYLDEYKKQIAQKLYATEDEVEVQDTADTPVEDEELLTQEEFDSLSEEDQELYLESLEQINELKKSTLGSYVKKAAKSQSDDAFDHGEDEHRQYGEPGEDPDRDKDIEDRERRMANRKKGISRAVNRLTKEETEQIDELSKGTLGRYVQKRVKQIPNIEVNYQMTPDEDGPMGAKRIKKFQKKINKGVTGALNRLSGTDVTKKAKK